ncbi:metalloregulator ArsR/SmtB family transcription factor [Termitidicoccus mucosus]
MQSSLEPKPEQFVITDVLYALSDTLRLAIVRRLVETGPSPCSACSLASEIPKSSLSHHLQVLRKAGLISTRRRGKELINCVRVADISARFPGLLGAVLSTASPSDDVEPMAKSAARRRGKNKAAR